MIAEYSTALGMLGVIIYVGSYAAMQLGFVKGQSYTYSILNTAAPALVLLSLMDQFNLSSAIIQVFWIAFSLIGITRLYYLSHRVRFSEEEKTFLKERFPTLSNDLARRFLDAGYWIDARDGKTLTDEGEQVPELVYIATGGATVSFGGHPIAACSADTFIGEITCFTREPASATVMIDQPSRCFCVPVRALNSLVDKTPVLRQALETSFASETGRKLRASNELHRKKELELTVLRLKGTEIIAGTDGQNNSVVHADLR